MIGSVVEIDGFDEYVGRGPDDKMDCGTVRRGDAMVLQHIADVT